MSSLRLLLFLAVFTTASLDSTWAQFGPTKRRSISQWANIDELVSSESQAYLNQIDAYLEAEQYSEAIESLQRVMGSFRDKIVRIATGEDESQYALGMRTYGHYRLSHLPPKALELYRSRVDPQARQWYEQGIEYHDPELLERVVREFYASSWTDDALYALGEFALTAGNYEQARAYWERLLTVKERGLTTPFRLELPTKDIPREEIYARLILVSILEGSTQRAETQLTKQLYGGKSFQERFPEAIGQLGGKSGKYVELLDNLLQQSQRWANLTPNKDWPTFGGSYRRTSQQPHAVSLASKAWKDPIPLQPVKVLPASISRQFSLRRIGEESGQPLSYFPLAVEDKLIVHHRPQLPEDGTRCKDRILVYNIHTGKPYWPVGEQQLELTGASPGEIFSSAESAPRYTFTSLDIPRYTMTVHRNLLFARVGSPVTFREAGKRLNQEEPPSSILCLDLDAKGKLVWQIPADDPEWAFEGAPICDGQRVYVGMKQRLGNPKPFVACYDAETTKLLWRQVLPSADTWNFGGDEVELSHNLLTLGAGMIYYNTNLGSVAALDAETGEIRWITLYPRQENLNLNQPQGYYYRSLNPCIYHQGMVFVAPNHTSSVLAFDALSGEILWELPLPDVTHLLGVYQDKLIASGDRIYWIEFDPTNRSRPGSLAHHWFGNAGPKGYGRGMMAEGHIYWPTRKQVMVFDAETAQLKQMIHLWEEPAFRELAGNLLLANEMLIVAQPDQLVGFHGYSEALEDKLERDARANPKSPATLLALARCQFKLHQWQQAAKSYQQYLAVAKSLDIPPPGYAQARLEFVETLIQQISQFLDTHEYTRALQLTKQSERQAESPAHKAKILLQRGDAAWGLKQREAAVSAWQEVLASARLGEALIPRQEVGYISAARVAAAKLDQTNPSEQASPQPSPVRETRPVRMSLLSNPTDVTKSHFPAKLQTSPNSNTLCVLDGRTLKGYSSEGVSLQWKQTLPQIPWDYQMVGEDLWLLHAEGCEVYHSTTGQPQNRFYFEDLPNWQSHLFVSTDQPEQLCQFSERWAIAPVHKSQLAAFDVQRRRFATTISVVGTMEKVFVSDQTNEIHILHRPLGVNSDVLTLSTYQLPAGTFIRSSELQGDPTNFLSVHGKLVIQTQQHLQLFDPHSGQMLWQQSLPTEGATELLTFQTEHHCLLLGTENGDVFCLRVENGEMLWSNSLSHTLSGSASYCVDDQTLFILHQGLLYRLEIASGRFVWERPQYIHPPESQGKLNRFGDQLVAASWGSDVAQLSTIEAASGQVIQQIALNYAEPVRQLLATRQALFVAQERVVSCLPFDTKLAAGDAAENSQSVH